MVLGDNPLIIHEKDPKPEPEVHVKLEVVGLGEVLQQIPLDVTENEPWLVTFPFPVALFEEILVAETVLTDGAVLDNVVKVS